MTADIIKEKENTTQLQTNKGEQKSTGKDSQKPSKLLKTLPKKHHFEYISALLSIPVLISVIALNLLNIQNNKKPATIPIPTPSPAKVSPIIIQESPRLSDTESSITYTPAPTSPPAACIKKVGPIDIAYPSENQTISDNPLCFVIDYNNNDYCSVVWSYQINNGNWSNYNNNAPCIYNPPQGNNTFNLRIQSTADQTQQTILTRHFIYNSPNIMDASTPTATPSAQ